MQLSIIIPILDEAHHLPRLLHHLELFRDRGVEIIVVDGGSMDHSVTLSSRWGARVISASRGRARQMNAGASIAQGDVLLFLHADTFLPNRAEQQIMLAMEATSRVWGRFAVEIQGRAWMLKIVALLMNIRSCLTGIVTGDQAMFMYRHAFIKVGGFPDLPLMEDITLSQHLLTLSRPICLTSKVITSGRRWEKKGVWRTIFLMWRLRWAYWRGVPADQLAQIYQK